MTKEGKNTAVEDPEEGGSGGFLPSIPDVMGWILTFLVVWLIYTLITRGVDYLQSWDLPSSVEVPKLPESISGEDVSKRVKSALGSVATDVTKQLDSLTNEVKAQKKQLLPAPQGAENSEKENREPLRRF